MKPSEGLPHDSAHLHVTGRSEYVDDRPYMRGELCVHVVYSTEARASFTLDIAAALEAPGVAGVLTAEDVADNHWGSIFQDQPVLAATEVNFAGEPIALVAADSFTRAREAAALIKIKYTPLPAIMSIDEAKAAGSFIGNHRKIERGDVEAALSRAPRTLKGRIQLRGADHFYLESQVAAAYPHEDGQFEIHSSTQHPTEVQHVVAHALGVPQNKIVCQVKRMGGAFGGKESQAAPIAAFAALAAKKFQRPARVVLTKDDDMIMTGKRNPFQNDYKVGFDDDGRILALDAQLFSDGGAYADLSTAIMERAMLHIDNAYYIPHVRVTGQVCRTNFHPHTAFRGFGGPKGVATIERILEEIAHVLGKDPLDVRKLNCYSQKQNITHYGQAIENCLLPELFERLEAECDYRARRREIAAHNQSARENGTPLRGLSMTAVKFGISFTTRFLNQANALVLIHRDGTLQVSTGATEMGQGVNARIAELVARELGLSRADVRMMPTTTDKNANTSPTAASSGTDLNGAAALIAARKIKSRLSELALHVLEKPESRWARHTAGLGTEPEVEAQTIEQAPDWPSGIAVYHGMRFEDGFVFSEKAPEKKITFQALVHEAYHNRISLSEYAHYKFPHLSFNKVTGQGRAFLYYTQGVAASEVSVDQDTGETKVLRTDILMDLGRPVNESLDMGQVYGGFVQGMGWVTTEKLFYSPKGLLLSHSPSTYKIPSVQDTPRVFNARLISNDGNLVNVARTKTSGEPPLLLALSVWTAVHDAVRASKRRDGSFPNIEVPATQEQVLRALDPEAFVP
ncbi:MAG TPA: molybdopterin cofactor-binding domain-containing protein [Bdellovibrionales bacterium]|nr:molybdopterin cofactor-binding domain-containing protein [Bdellovibrionales bacterium]